MKPIRTLIAEDHTILREGLKALFGGVADIRIVGEVGDGHEAVKACEELQPDLVLLDLSMPRMTGMEALRQIKQRNGAVKVLILTVHRTEEHLYTALQNGADGYALKDSAAEELVLAVRSVMAGHRYLCPRISTQVIDGYLGQKEGGAARSLYDELSNREREILKLIAEGHRNRQIAEMLCISIKTVEKHRSNVMRKLGLHNVQGLTAYAIEKGLVTP
jgi:DNA-binding NarL/FixJ family response regulator